MRTIKLKILGVLATLLFGATVSYGQSVYYDELEGGVVIDCTMMPAGTVLAVGGSKASEDTEWQLPSHDETSDVNKVYPKLVVATEDLSSNRIGIEIAIDKAKAYVDDKDHDDWRLPNQRELMLIWVLRDEIERTTSSETFDRLCTNYYFSSTRYSLLSNCYWYVIFDNGYTNSCLAGEFTTARAVREIK